MFKILFGKKPRKNTIKNAAEHLISIYGCTTTLEVKKYLRAMGYIAFQWDISKKMDAICDENRWAFNFNGQFRVYFMPTQLAVTHNANYSIPAFSAN